MHNKLIRLVLLLLIVAIALTAAVACTSKENTDNNTPDDGGGNGSEIDTPTINKSVIFADIKNGLINAGNRITGMSAGTRHVTSEYTLRVDNVNVSVRYDANYDIARPEDSEIMLSAYDNFHEENAVFVYYKDKTLYYAVGGKRVEMPGFGSTSSFDMFYEIITFFDMAGTFYNEDFAGDIESLSTLAESANITRYALDENTENITVRDINLDRLKGTVNEYITNNITSLGTKLDALSSLFFGFNVSDLGKVEIGLFNATKLMVVLDKLDENTSAVSKFDIVFDGTQTNYISKYHLSVSYVSEEGSGKIQIPGEVDPSLNTDYDSERYGQIHLTGTVNVPKLNAEFYLEAKGDLNTLDNSLNKYAVVLTDRKGGDAVVAANYYYNGKLYIDIEGLIDGYLGNIADFNAIGLPKTVYEGVDLASELGKIVSDIVTSLAAGIELPDFGEDDDTDTDDDNGWKVLLDKIRSENGVFYVTVDSEFLSEVIGSGSSEIVDYIATMLGVDSTFIDEILELGLADDLALELAFDTVNKGIGAVLYSAGEEVLSMDLTINSVPESGLNIELPSEAELAQYRNPVVPDTVLVEVSGEFNAQGKEFNDISAFMGIFIGDVTGKNTACTLKVSDVLNMNGYVYETGGEVYFAIDFAINGTPYLTVVSDPADAGKIYVDYKALGIKYVIAREVLLDGASALTGTDVWDGSSIAEIYELVSADASVSLENGYITVRLVSQKDDDNSNPLLDLFNLESISAGLRLRIGFEAPELTLDASEYSVPAVVVYNPVSGGKVDNAVWNSIYEAVWYDSAAVTIGGNTLIMKLTYSEESVTLVTGVYEYHPVASLFGQTVTYTMQFTDNVNGTSVVSALESYSFTVDPSKEKPFADTVSVIYNNGKYGALPYVLEYKDGTAFPYNNSNVSQLLQGLAPAAYYLVIGKGSIAETRFEINMTVLGRVIKVNAGDYYNEIPIVARVTIDPYEYSLRKTAAEAAGGNYYPIRYREDDPATADIDESSALYITFYSYPGSNSTETITLPEFAWGFEEKLITAKGGEYVVVAEYQTLKIALVVTVLAKEVDYIKINSENNGYYTVDALVTSTYTIPTSTTADNEVRIYFKSGHYRIIGSEPQEGASTDPLCDGYYNIPLEWNYPVANYVSLDGSWPLNNGRDEFATAYFGDNIVGKQAVSVHVICPKRIIGTRSDAVIAVTYVRTDNDGNIVESVTNPIRASLASFTANGTVEGSYFYFDPYSEAVSNLYLPGSVFVEVEYQGVTVMREYPVRWLTGRNGANDNIISGDGRILNAFAEETYLTVYGVIGDGELTQTLTMLILNRSGSYENVVMLNDDDTPFEGITVYKYDEEGNPIAEDDTETPVAYKRYYIENLNPYDELKLPARLTLEFAEDSGIPDSTYNADWYTPDGVPASQFTPNPGGGTYIVQTGIMGESDTGMLDQIIELYLVFDEKTVVNDRIYGLYADADTGSIPTYTLPDGTKLPYVDVDTYTPESSELYDKLIAGVTTVGIGFRDGSMSTGVRIDWLNLEEFCNALASPLGSSEYYNAGKYEGGIIILRGVIEKGTPLEQEVSLGFRIAARVITGMNFNKLSSDFTKPDASGVIPVDSNIEIVRYSIGEDGKLVTNGTNAINITFNKFYTLRGTYYDENGSEVTGLCTPSQYVNYLFGAISLSFSDSSMVNPAVYTLRDDFDDFVYGRKSPSASDTDITVTDNYITIRFTVEKLTEGSCVQSFSVTLNFLRDVLAETDYSLGIETFDENGNPLYETQDGYVLPTAFTVRYLRSGEVEYDNLVWRAANAETGANGVSISAGQVVTSIKYEFFRFSSGRNITLETTLPGGQVITFRLVFYKKNVGLTGYSTADEGLYKITDGTLVIENVYDVMPVEEIPGKLANVIIPKQTTQYESPYSIAFTLVNGWKPAPEFDDGNGNFSTDKIRGTITSAGAVRQLFATAEIRGYNGEVQTINLYIEVVALDGGQVTHEDYEIVANRLVFDQYSDDANNGTLTLPKDIKVSFGSVFYQFSADSDIKYELRDVSDGLTEVTELTYNNRGHTMGSEFGDSTAELYLVITLPDGNNGVNLVVVFPDRLATGAEYLNKSNTGADGYIEGKYYIDPYDAATYNLPLSARIMYQGAYEGVDKTVTWIPYGVRAEGAFTAQADGSYRYNGGGYGGDEYLFYTVLKSFDDGDEEQYLVLHVIVLNRSIHALPDEISKTLYPIDNPFTALVKDIPSELDEGHFLPLDTVRGVSADALAEMEEIVSNSSASSVNLVYDADSFGTDSATVALYSDYLAVSAPVIPSITWYKEIGEFGSGEFEPLTDDDISVLGGFMIPVLGILGYGEGGYSTEGQTVSTTLTADRWEFFEINGINDFVIEFNPYTYTSIATSFEVEFRVYGSSGSTFRVITFYPENYAATDEELRAVIIFNKTDWSSNETSSVSFVNFSKTAESNRVTTDKIYTLDAQQIGIDEISFGYGVGYAVSGQVELVIDPLNPVIPDKALARGKILTGSGEIVDLEEVDVVWEDAVYDLPLAGDRRSVSATVSKAGVSAEIVVQVIYLDRTPQAIYTTERGFTTAATPVDNYFTLMLTTVSGTGVIRNNYLTIDPINSNLYVPEGANAWYEVAGGDPALTSYKLPSTLKVTFANDYSVGSTEAEGAAKLGNELYLSEVKWLLSRDITLTNTGNITARIRSFRVSYEYNGETYTSEPYDFFADAGVLGTQYNLLMSTTDRRVEYTSISAVPEGSDIDYQKAFDEFYIDPYDIKFPESISVKFTGSSIEENYHDIVWEYDETYLERTDVISGKIGEEFMFVTASMQVYGTKLDIQFTIKARNIDITVITPDGQETTEPLSGGTLYVRKGVPIEEQLPTQLYYRFDYADNTSQIAAVPLSFTAANLPNIDNVEAGMTYTNVRGTLGTVDLDNIYFTIIVIDPKLYAVNEETSSVTVGNVTTTVVKYTNGGFYYDYIPVGVNRAGQYVAGPETSTLPDKVIVTADGAYMNVLGVEYDLANMVAVFRCNYTFLSFSDSPYLSGDAEGTGPDSDKMEMTFTVPIRTYDYTSIEARTADFSMATVRFPLGQTITSSDMPATVNGIQPLWAMQNVNQNRAGEYVVTCSFKNAYGEIVTGSMTVIFEKKAITEEDITWTTQDGVNFLNRVYTGETLDVTKYFTIGNFLREDGNYGPLQGYSIQYSIDGGLSWQNEQPVAVKLDGAPDYRIRITVAEGDDYNITGSVTYILRINKCVIYAEDIYFHTGDDVPITESEYTYVNGSGGESSVMVKQVTYTYDGNEHSPMIGGVPQGASYELIYASYDPENTNPAYNPVLRPINVGHYIMRMTFVEDQRNYTMDAGMQFTIVIHIVKPEIQYSVKGEMEYNGTYRDAIVVIGDEPVTNTDIRFEFIYKTQSGEQLPVGSKIRDAGTYLVTVKVYGGNNWPSYNTGEPGVPTLGTLIEREVIITPREITVNINKVESEYLEQLKPFDSSVTVTWTVDPSEPGLVGTDTIAIFGDLDIGWTGGELTYKHMVGSYDLRFNAIPSNKNYHITVVNGTYEIVARSAGALVISDKAALDAALATLKDGDTVRWYLMAGNYGDITVTKNASVAIIGSYDLTAQEEKIAVVFGSVTVNAGDVTLDIVSFAPKASSASVSVGSGAGSVTVSRAEFIGSGTNIIVDSVGIRARTGYSGVIEIKESVFRYYSTAVYLESGAVNISDSEFYYNNMGVNAATGDITLNDNSFRNTRGAAVYIGSFDSEVSIFGNEFLLNNIAIKTNTPLRNDIRVQNDFRENAVTFEGWSDE